MRQSRSNLVVKTRINKIAVATGTDSLFLEVHSKPDKAFCNGLNMIALSNLESLLSEIKKINKVVRGEI